MKTDVMLIMPSPAPEFNFDSACTSPYATAPSSPARFFAAASSFYSAPTSPSRSAAEIPFYWETKPGTPKNNTQNGDVFVEDDFEFEFSGGLQRYSVSDADELFSGGKIKPLKPPPRIQFGENSILGSPKSPNEKLIRAFSPRNRNKDLDPFEEALKQSKKQGKREEKQGKTEKKQGTEDRGRDRKPTNRREKKGTHRSLSPFRVFDIFSEKETNRPISSSDSPSSAKTKIEKKPSLFSFSFSNRYKNWKLKDLLLFRSASEGRKDQIIGTEPVNNLAISRRKCEEDVKSSSFRSIDSTGSNSGSGMKRRGSLSAHEVHYNVNRAVQEEMKKKTPLPYKHGLMGLSCLGIEPVVQDLAKSFGSSRHG